MEEILFRKKKLPKWKPKMGKTGKVVANEVDVPDDGTEQQTLTGRVRVAENKSERQRIYEHNMRLAREQQGIQ